VSKYQDIYWCDKRPKDENLPEKKDLEKTRFFPMRSEKYCEIFEKGLKVHSKKCRGVN
jgi:hypothetical protein